MSAKNCPEGSYTLKGSLDTFNKFILINDVIDNVVQVWVFVFVWALETEWVKGKPSPSW